MVWAIIGLAVLFGSGRAESDPTQPTTAETPSHRLAGTWEAEKKLLDSEQGTFEEETQLRQELERLQKELLTFPKKRHYRVGWDSEMTYDANRDAGRIGDTPKSKGETTFRIKPFGSYDLSGRKTDVRLEYGWSRIYGVKIETSDLMNQDLSLRMGRKIFKKTSLSLNDRFALKGQRSTSIGQVKRLTWDQSHRAGLTYEVTPKIQMVLESDYSRTDHPHEEFDQDTTYTYAWSPTAFFQVTPKSRFSAAYRMSFSRTPPETGDATTHQIRGSYAFKVTPKSSASVDLGYSIQNPDSAAASTSDSTVVSLGYLWQITPKTGFRMNYSRTFTDSTADSVTTLIQTGTDSRSDSLGLAFGFRPHRKASTELSFNGSHSRTKTAGGDATGTKTRSWTYPFQISTNLSLAQWVSLTISYTYTHQITDERELQEVRDHALVVTSNISY